MKTTNHIQRGLSTLLKTRTILSEKPTTRFGFLTCVNRFEAAKNVDKTGIVKVGSGEFSVISHTDNAIRYRVSFVNDENMPYCTCSSWKKSYYP